MFIPRDFKYNICSGRRNDLMYKVGINKCGVNNVLCREKMYD